ncbi:hypothetical protein GM30_05005 [Trabulsiella odontotermitis]|nr:hypothetical protein GM30_05005 [Trabulsiella odontotermitis]
MTDMYIVVLMPGIHHIGRFGYPPTFIVSVITCICIGLQDIIVFHQMPLQVGSGEYENHTAVGIVELAL